MTRPVQRLIGLPALTTRQTFTRRDTILYALGVGAGFDDPTDPAELCFVYEQGLQALPTMASVLAAPGAWLLDPVLGLDWRRILNAGQTIELHQPLPVEGEVRSLLTVDAVYDKGSHKGALLQSSRKLYLADGSLVATVTQAHLLRGDGGFGGSEQLRSEEVIIPGDRDPDHVVDLATRPEQGLLYRLSGDFNPLHVDPVVARAAGYARPLLHGSCTYGIAGRAILRSLCENQPGRLLSLGARFSSPVYPGETIRTEIWRLEGQAVFRCRSANTGSLVLDRGTACVA